MSKRLLTTLSLLMVLLLTNHCFSQNIYSVGKSDTLTNFNKRHAIVVEGLGKFWGVSLNYEYKFNPKFSGGIGFGLGALPPGVVGYGIYRTGRNRNHFVTTVGLTFLDKRLSPSIGAGYEVESDYIYFRVIPFALIALDGDYPLLPSIGLNFGVKI